MNDGFLFPSDLIHPRHSTPERGWTQDQDTTTTFILGGVLVLVLVSW